MNSNPLISVIMPVYNCASYIEEAVESVLNQTVINFEFIIIDDASTDDTANILKKITDSRIKLIFKVKNQGVSSAINDGLRLAKGKYIARMDGDDITVNNRFEKQVAILENNPNIFICGSWVQYLGGNNEVLEFKEIHSDIITELLLSCSMCMGTSMFRRKELSHYFFDETKKSGEDYDFWSKVAWFGEFYNIQEVLLLYRVHPNQASFKHKPQQIQDDIEIKLFLFKKLNYDTIKYTNGLITKMLLLDQPIQIKELELFLKWLKKLLILNCKTKIFPQKEFINVLNRIKRTLLFSLYFKTTNIGITKKWRIKAMFKLDLKDILYILKLKSREVAKAIIKA